MNSTINVKLSRLVKTMSAALFAAIPPTVTLMKISLQPPRSRGTTLQDYDEIFTQLNRRLRRLYIVHTHNNTTHCTECCTNTWTSKEVSNHIIGGQVT